MQNFKPLGQPLLGEKERSSVESYHSVGLKIQPWIPEDQGARGLQTPWFHLIQQCLIRKQGERREK